MRDDLLDAQAAVDWGEAQLPILERRFLSWHTASIEIAFEQSNTNASKKVAVAREKVPFPPIIHADVGATINSLRSSLDILAASLARRSGVAPSHNTHFPIFRSFQDFADPLTGIENKKWLGAAEIEIVKSLRPYEGGNGELWSLHQLDIKRKHERLIALSIRPLYMLISGSDAARDQTRPVIQRLENKTILFEFPGDGPEPQITTTLEIIFDEVALPVVHGERVITTLKRLAATTQAIIKLFDYP